MGAYAFSFEIPDFVLTAILVLLLLQNVFLTHEQLVEWGWRIPFVIGAMRDAEPIPPLSPKHDMPRPAPTEPCWKSACAPASACR